jgi:PAS domain S-box-containing protein
MARRPHNIPRVNDDLPAEAACVELPPALREELLDPAAWQEGLETYARTTNLAVSLTDGEGRLIGKCIHPQATWSLLQAKQAAAAGRCPFSLAPPQPCTCVGDALARGARVLARDRTGLVHFAVPLALGEHALGALVAGQVFDRYPEQLALEHVAEKFGLPPGEVWQRARREYPVKQATLEVYGDLLATLGNAFLRTRYHTLLEAHRLAEMTRLRDLLLQLNGELQKFKFLSDNASDAHHLLDPEARFLYVNKVACERLGYSEQELLKLSLPDIDLLYSKERVQELFERSKTERVPPFEAIHRRKDGSTFPVEINIMPVELRGAPYLFANARDITERKRAEEQREQLLTREQTARAEAEAANRTKDEFLATLSHELRTPLNAMLGWSRLLRAGDLNAETTARALETIERNAKAQSQLIEDLLDVSRVISGKLSLHVRPIELVSIIEAAVDAVRLAAEAKNIELQVTLDPMTDPVSGDPDRLQQVVWNLLLNAVKFTPQRGRVQVRLERINSHVEITVSDTGKGIGKEFLPYVFDRFRQADSSITRKQGGLGLGLAIVRHLVEMHGGTVRACSPGEGQGATFTVELPLAVNGDRGLLPVELPPRSRLTAGASYQTPLECLPRLDSLRVLVVEDEVDARDLVVTVLGRCKAQVRAVASVAEALDVLQGFKPDVLVSDIEMPGEDGYALIRKVRAMEAERGGRIPAAALTAHAKAEDRLRALSSGYDVHVSKPFEPVTAYLTDSVRC